jgi:hypothetical protein
VNSSRGGCLGGVSVRNRVVSRSVSVSVMSWSVPSYRVSYDETIESIWNGEVHPSEIPRISVFDLDGRLYSINNRRLFVWRVLACKGKVKDVRPMMTWHQFRDTPQARQAMVQWSFPVHMELAEVFQAYPELEALATYAWDIKDVPCRPPLAQLGGYSPARARSKTSLRSSSRETNPC